MQTTIMPNAPVAATEQNAVVTDDSIAAKMTAMRQQTLRNQIGTTSETEEVTGAFTPPATTEEDNSL